MENIVNETQMIKMNLTLPKEVFVVLRNKAENEFIKVSTFTRQLIMKNLPECNNVIKHTNGDEK